MLWLRMVKMTGLLYCTKLASGLLLYVVLCTVYNDKDKDECHGVTKEPTAVVLKRKGD